MESVTMRLPIVRARLGLRARAEALAWQVGAAAVIGLAVGVLCAAVLAGVTPPPAPRAKAGAPAVLGSLVGHEDGGQPSSALPLNRDRVAAAAAAGASRATTAAPRGPTVAAAALADEEAGVLTGELHGSVYAPDFGPALRARLLGLDDDVEMASVPVEPSGGFTFSRVPAGCYALGFTRPGLAPVRLDPESGRVCIPEGSGTFIAVVLAP